MYYNNEVLIIINFVNNNYMYYDRLLFCVC